MEKQMNSFKLTRSKNIKLEILFFIITIIIIVTIGLFITIKYTQFKEENNNLFNALEYCKVIYTNLDINKTADVSEVDECLTLLSIAPKVEIRDSMIREMKQAKEFLNLKNEIISYFAFGVVKSDISMEDILYFDNKIQQIDDKYQDSLNTIVVEMESQYSKISSLNSCVNGMYETEEKLKLRSNLTRDEYNKCVVISSEVKQDDIKQQYSKYIESAEKYITKKEKEEAERKRQEEIKKAWVKLDVPYISQNLNYVYNGCEAASMLMALQYKGYLLDMDIITYSKNMPKSNDPNTGFYLDIFSKEPKGEAHWIAPIPLAEYGISSSGNNNIIDATGYELSELSNEIINGNPVIIYLTYDFREPYNWSKTVPNNLHVQLLSGYNTITQQYLITDPYTRWDGKYEFILSKKDIEYLYNVVGRRAVIVR